MVYVIRQKVYICRVRGDPERREFLATQCFAADRFEVLWYGAWRQYFKDDLEDIRLVRLVAEEVSDDHSAVGDDHPPERGG